MIYLLGKSERREAGINIIILSCLTADIWSREKCGTAIPDSSKGQPNQQRDAREWLGLY